jgi:type II secretory pathway component PulK
MTQKKILVVLLLVALIACLLVDVSESIATGVRGRKRSFESLQEQSPDKRIATGVRGRKRSFEPLQEQSPDKRAEGQVRAARLFPLHHNRHIYAYKRLYI